MTEQYDEVDEQAQSALRNVFWGVVRKGGTKESMMKEFDSVLSQIFQPNKASGQFAGDTRSPGMPPGKVVATPGRSGTSGVTTSRIGDRPTGLDRTGRPAQYGQQHPQAYDSSGEFSSSEDSEQPPYKINSQEPGIPDPTKYTYGSRARITSGDRYSPDMVGRGVLKEGLARFEKERGTQASINPGTTPLLTDEDIAGDDGETEAELAERIVQERNKPTAPTAEFAPTTIPKETTRDIQGYRPGETRKRIHPSYRGEN